MVLSLLIAGLLVLFVPLIFVVLLDIRENTREMVELLEMQNAETKEQHQE